MKLYGNIPNKLPIRMNKKSVNMKEKYLTPSFPTLSLIMLDMNSKVLSTIVCDLEGTIFKFRIPKYKKERITKTQSTANFILWGGAVICPILLGLIVSVFGSGKAGSFELNVDLSLLNQSLFFYMMVLGAGGVWMQSVILQTTKTAIWRMPMYMFIATTTLLLALRISIV